MSRAFLLKGVAVMVTAVVAAGVALVLTDGAGAAVPGPAQAWVDDPLDGAVVPPGPISIVAHAYDPAGVAEMTLWVDGVETATATPAAAGQVLVSAEWSWVAVDDGVYVLEVFGQDANGNQGLPGRAIITVGLDGEPTEPLPPTTSTTLLAGTTTTDTLPPETTTTTAVTTTRPQTTTSPPTTTTSPPTTTAPPTTTTPTSTTTTCPPGTPVLVFPPDGYSTSPFFPAPPLEWSYSGCPITGFTVELARDTGFSTGLVSQTFGSTTTQWNVINTLEPGQWYWRVRALDRPQVGPWSATWGFTKG